jgi:hypothetical protein
LMEDGEHEDGRLTHARLGLTEDVLTYQGEGQAFLLNCRAASSRQYG